MEFKWITDWKSNAVQSGLKKVWMECFNDTQTYIDFFFENAPENIQVIAGFENEMIISAFYLFPCQVKWKESEGTGEQHTKKAYYLYAGGVLRDYRGNKVFSGMYQEIFKKAEYESAHIILYALPEMRPFYEKKGLMYYYDSNEISFALKNDEQCLPEREELEAETYEIMRNRRFDKESFVVWDKEMLGYCLKEKRFCGGFCDILKIENQQFAIIGEIKDEVMHVEETTIPLELLKLYQSSILNLYKVSQMKVRIQTAKNEGKRINAGMGDVPAASLWLSLTLQ